MLLKKVLKELEIEGTVERKRGGLHHAGALPPVIVADILSRDFGWRSDRRARRMGRKRAASRPKSC